MKFEKLDLKKFEPYALKAKNLKNCFGGKATGGGSIGVGQGVRESYTSDTEHANGGASWEHTDFIISDSPGTP